MRHISKILRDLGFNQDASPSVQQAFYRHLVRHAESSSQQNPEVIPKPEGRQLSFDEGILDAGNPSAAARKSGTR